MMFGLFVLSAALAVDAQSLPQDTSSIPTLFGTPEQSVGDVEVILTNRVTELNGRVVDARGAAFADAIVVAFAADRARWYAQSRFVTHSTPDRDAVFTMRGLAPGEYNVAAIDRGQAADVESELANPEFLESLVAEATRVTVAEGQTVSLPHRLTARHR